jgi:uncharacterized membrane protein YphA (DoxX/SURF4 family)
MTTQAVTLGTKQESGKALHYALWGVQLLLGLMFTMAGLMKATKPIAELAPQIPWTAVVPVALTRFIGVSELAGGIGVLLPALTRILPRLTGVAAAGLTLVMILATGFHIVRGEFGAVPITVVLGGLAAFVAWGRLVKVPIQPRG